MRLGVGGAHGHGRAGRVADRPVSAGAAARDHARTYDIEIAVGIPRAAVRGLLLALVVPAPLGWHDPPLAKARYPLARANSAKDSAEQEPWTWGGDALEACRRAQRAHQPGKQRRSRAMA